MLKVGVAPPPAPASPDPDQVPWIAQLQTVDLEARVTGPRSRCATAKAAADDWQPEATTVAKARRIGAAAIERCVSCPVRAECLEREMRDDVLGHSRDQRIRAGFTGGELREMRPKWLAGTSVLDLLWPLEDTDTDTGADIESDREAEAPVLALPAPRDDQQGRAA